MRCGTARVNMDPTCADPDRSVKLCPEVRIRRRPPTSPRPWDIAANRQGDDLTNPPPRVFWATPQGATSRMLMLGRGLAVATLLGLGSCAPPAATPEAG